MNLSTRSPSPRAAIILAGGEGLRMRSVTRFITGQDDVPKQFCPMMDGLTWFENTRNRVAQLIPVDRSFIVVKQSHRHLYEPLLGDLRRSPIVAQPCDRGIAPAILYGLMCAKRLGPHTTVAIFPSDHYISDDARFMRQVERAFDAVDAHPALAVLLGIRPDKAETSYGWIEPAARMSSWTPNLFRSQAILGKTPLGVGPHSAGRRVSLEQRSYRGPCLAA
jgi:mannose-1-phosphate guanylyltransferase